MRSYFLGATTALPSTTVANYANFQQYVRGWDTTATGGNMIPHALTLDHLYIALTTPPGVGKSYTFTVVVNGVATSLGCTVDGSNTTAQNTSVSVSLAAGDRVRLRCTPSGTPDSPGTIRWYARQDAADVFAVVGSTGSVPGTTGVLGYYNLNGTSTANTAEVNNATPCPANGVFKTLRVAQTNAPGVGKSITYTLYKNSVSTGLEVTITDTATTAQVTGANISVAAGDILCLVSTPTGTPGSTGIVHWGLSFDPTIDGESFFLGAIGSFSNTVTNYATPFGDGSTPSATESTAHTFVLGPSTVKALYVALALAVGATTRAYTFTVRRNLAATTAVATVNSNGTAANHTGDTIAVAAGDSIGLELAPANTPTSGNRVKTGILIYIESTPTFIPQVLMY